MKGKLIHVKKEDEVFAYEFSKDLCAIFNKKLDFGLYLIIQTFDHDFCEIMIEESILMVRTETIKSLIL